VFGAGQDGPAAVDEIPLAGGRRVGVSWILDGLEGQLVSAGGSAGTFNMSSAEIGLTGTLRGA
jgi:hypothetical protein